MCMKEREELIALLKHMKHHNEHHVNDINDLKKRADKIKLPELSEELEICLGLLEHFDLSLAKALKIIENN